jgi:hypothetical protein
MSMYVTGDTLVIDDLREIPQRHPRSTSVCGTSAGPAIPGVLGLGLMVTMDGQSGAELLEIVPPAITVPIHYDDYGVFTSPAAGLWTRWERRGCRVCGR